MNKEIIETFENEQKLISKENNISYDHAGCYLVNGGVDDYLCIQRQCKQLSKCIEIRNTELDC